MSDSCQITETHRDLGHEDIHTTEACHGHYDLSDLEAATEAFARRDKDPN